MGLLSVYIGSGPLGFAHFGLLAGSVGASAACTIIALPARLRRIQQDERALHRGKAASDRPSATSSPPDSTAFAEFAKPMAATR